MKQLLTITALVTILYSCKKDMAGLPNQISLIDNIKIQLKDSMAKYDFQLLDFQNAGITKTGESDSRLLKIPFLKQKYQDDFVLLRIEKDGSFSLGKILSIRRNQTDSSLKSPLIFNGSLLIYSLSRRLIVNSAITNGYVEAFHSDNNVYGKPMVVPIIAETLPEVIVVASHPKNGSGMLFTNWYNIRLLFSQTDIYGGGGGGGYYTNTTNTGSSGIQIPHELDQKFIDFEPVEDLPPIDLIKYLKCFSNIPDEGATCTIKILTDIPVDTDPTVFFSPALGSPGHTFIQLRKSNGNQSIQQNIGFYPKQGWKLIGPLPVDGKFVDNADHEFNASLTMNLTADKFYNTLNHIIFLSNIIKYDLGASNCTDFALNVFNFERESNKLIIAPIIIPGDNSPNGTNTPQALYDKLKGIKEKTTNPDSKNVTIPGVKGFAGKSNGPCN